MGSVDWATENSSLKTLVDGLKALSPKEKNECLSILIEAGNETLGDQKLPAPEEHSMRAKQKILVSNLRALDPEERKKSVQVLVSRGDDVLAALALVMLQKHPTPIEEIYVGGMSGKLNSQQNGKLSFETSQSETFEKRRDALSQKLAGLGVQKQEASQMIDLLRPIIEEMEPIDKLPSEQLQKYAKNLEVFMKQIINIGEVSNNLGTPNNAKQCLQATLETFNDLRVYINEDGLSQYVGEKLLRENLPGEKSEVDSLNKSFEEKIGSTTNEQKTPSRQPNRSTAFPYPDPSQRSSAKTSMQPQHSQQPRDATGGGKAPRPRRGR